jgi:hypothetical protein
VVGHRRLVRRPDRVRARAVTGYVDERFWRSAKPHGVRRAGNHHRTLATYLNAVVRAGFTLEAVAEPAAGPRLTRQQPVYAEVPIFFAARARRTGQPAPRSSWRKAMISARSRVRRILGRVATILGP